MQMPRIINWSGVFFGCFDVQKKERMMYAFLLKENGRYRTRTYDLSHVKRMLSQLS